MLRSLESQFHEQQSAMNSPDQLSVLFIRFLQTIFYKPYLYLLSPHIVQTSRVADPERFIPDPDPNFYFWILDADPDPTGIFKLIKITKKTKQN